MLTSQQDEMARKELIYSKSAKTFMSKTINLSNQQNDGNH
jgi:hypothetical protein